MRNLLLSLVGIKLIFLNIPTLGLLGIMVFGTTIPGTEAWINWAFAIAIVYIATIWFILHLPAAGAGGVMPFRTPVEQRLAILGALVFLGVSIFALVVNNNEIFTKEISKGILLGSAILTTGLDVFAAYRLITAEEAVAPDTAVVPV